ncbi:MAG TPA: hypothetical protein VFJ85_13080 [Acidimicrobiales bacterium]|nr:hypothetical protein [Acidimicrobiales bacterium]
MGAHLPWASPAERLRVVDAAAGALEGTAWYTLDGVGDGETEVAVHGAPPDLPGAGDWHAPCAERSALFTDGLPAALVTDVLVACTARAVTVLRATAAAGRGRAAAEDVADEAACCYASLVAGGDERRATLAAHHAWLCRTAARQGTSLEGGPGVRSREAAPDARLAALGAALDEASGADRPLKQKLVARAVHIQVVRLRGPDDRSLLAQEAALVAALAATSST